MKLTVFNGSPRKAKSNSTILIDHFIKGYNSYDTYTIDNHYLADSSKTTLHVEAFAQTDTAIIIFPLYTDAMPGQVKHFFESLDTIDTKGKTVGFIVQSGFPEAHHSIFIERYLEKLSRRKEWIYLGTVIKGGVEGIQIMPPSMTKKLYTNFETLGRTFVETGKFDPVIKSKLRKPYRMNFASRTLFRLVILLGLSNFYWNTKLRENNAFDRRFAQPYLTKGI
jgi:NAD(P)H-dependent FMN reductase